MQLFDAVKEGNGEKAQGAIDAGAHVDRQVKHPDDDEVSSSCTLTHPPIHIDARMGGWRVAG